MKTSKPFAFVLWVNGEELPVYLAERLKVCDGFRFAHWIHHEPEEEPAPLIDRVSPQKGKPHWHCVASFNRPMDYDLVVGSYVEMWAKNHPEYGARPFTYNRTHEGKVLNLSAWMAYVIHHPRYMAYLEAKKERPESFKTAYQWSDIHSTDDELLNEHALTAAAWLDMTCRSLESYQNAVEYGATSRNLISAISECKNYQEMQIARAAFFATHAVYTTPPPFVPANVPSGTHVTHTNKGK